MLAFTARTLLKQKEARTIKENITQIPDASPTLAQHLARYGTWGITSAPIKRKYMKRRGIRGVR
jgi:hypothetical protein